MPDYRRWYQPGGSYFFTLVTARRQPLFRSAIARRLLGKVIRVVQQELPCSVIAAVLLPDHLHMIWQLPVGDASYPERWQRIKSRFSRAWSEFSPREARISPAQSRRGHRGVWQRRYWEHLIRDESEQSILCDYIHYNPVKHGHAIAPKEWQASTFHRFVKAGEYQMDWGHTCPPHLEGLNYE